MAQERQPLSEQRILAAAIRLVDAEGLDALTMRRLGSELGVEGMSLYKHVPNKEALLFGLVQAIVEEIEPSYDPPADWTARLRAVMRSYRQVGMAHPSIFLLTISRPWYGVAWRRLEEDISTLRSAGFQEDEAGYALRTLISYTTGFIARAITSALYESQEPNGIAEQLPPLDAHSYPNLAACYAYLRDPQGDAAFDFGVDVMLKGLEVILEETRSRSRETPRGRHIRTAPRQQRR